MFKGQSSQNYHPVPQNSDSEEDEVTLYAAPEPRSSSADHTFGTGVYNRDLRLDLASPGLPKKIEHQLKEKRRMLYSALVCLLLAIVVIAFALTIVVYAQSYLPGVNENTNSTENEQCKPPPVPLPGKANGCSRKPAQTTGDQANQPPKHFEHEDPLNKPSNNGPGAKSPNGVGWIQSFFPGRSELSLQYVDINRDGTLDVISSVANSLCAVRLIALDGVTGHTVWETVVKFEFFSLRCVIDVNQDGVMDCIAAGRDAGFTALSGVDGTVLWVVDSSITYPNFNYLFPLVVDDLDSDGVPDLINTHGGGMDYAPEDTDRLPSFLVVVSGRTGAKLMDPILIPDGHETYCSPVLYKFGAVDLVLFGSGGETISGSLWAITLDSIKLKVQQNASLHSDYSIKTEDTFHPCFMNKDFIESISPAFNSSFFDEQFTNNDFFFSQCPKIGNKELIWNAYNLCFYEIYDSSEKGIMVPPVIIDLNSDGVNDLLLQTFHGELIAWDGSNLATVLWKRIFEGTESYSIPSPLFYNEDQFPDLLIRTDVGVWDHQYTASNIFILDGRTGATLWSHHSDHSVMNSGVSVASDSHGGDAVFFYSVDKLFPSSETKREKRDQTKPPDSFVGPQSKGLWVSTPDDQFPDPDKDLSGFLQYCSEVVDISSASVYFITREMVESGLEIKPLITEMPIVLKDPVLPDTPPGVSKRHADKYSRATASSFEGNLGEAKEDIRQNYRASSSQSENQPPAGSKDEDDKNGFQGKLPVNFDPSKFDPNDFDPSKFDPNDFDPNNFDLSNPNQDQGDLPPGFNAVDMNNKRLVRCSFVTSPTNNVPTPVIGDVNGDGNLEVSYAFQHQADPQNMMFLGIPTDKINIRTFTIEDKFIEVYGRGVLDFSRFLAAGDQPWGQYMGRAGDNVFQPKHKLRDS